MHMATIHAVSAELGQQRGMDVHDATWKGVDKLGWNLLEVAGQGDEIGGCGLDGGARITDEDRNAA
jgi:hypothetical protein